MPLLSFSVLRDLIETGKKKQTIRLPRKSPLKVGDKLYLYWKCRTPFTEKLGEGVITKLVTKSAMELTDQDAVLDGFINRADLWEELNRLHPEINWLFQKVDVITWDWTYKENHSWFATPERRN
jgi:hypothetical protein